MKGAIEARLREVRRNFELARSREEISSTSTALSVSRKSLKGLHKFYDDKRAMFKSPE